MKRRTFISLMGVMAAAGVLSMTGCSSKDTAASTASSATLNKLDSIQKNGKLVVALEGAWQPWSYHDSSDTLVGYDVEGSRAIAEKLGVEPEQAADFAAQAELAAQLDADGVCCRVSQLAVNGRDLMAAGIPAGPGLRRTLEALLDAVIRGQLPNERQRLLDAVRENSAS